MVYFLGLLHNLSKIPMVLGEKFGKRALRLLLVRVKLKAVHNTLGL
jgi:hypothetical protein